MRNTKAIANKAKEMEVTPIGNSEYRVFSTSEKNYIVRLSQTNTNDHCECKWFYYGGKTCSHIVAVHCHLEGLAGRKVAVHSDLESALRQHRPRIRTGDLTLTTRITRKIKSTSGKPPIWLQAKMVKDHKGPSQELNKAYQAGTKVYLRYTGKPEGNWIVFSGARDWQHIALATSQAQEFVKVSRSGGKAIKAKFQGIIEDQYQMSL